MALGPYAESSARLLEVRTVDVVAGRGLVWAFYNGLGDKWANRAPLGDPAFGINYSCDQAEYLLLEDPAAPGSYRIDSVEPGPYEAVVERPGYETDPYELSGEELQHLLDSAPAPRARERKSPFRD